MKQVIVIRHDLHMRMGKAVAQGAHASMMWLVAGLPDVAERLQKWVESGGLRKICLRVESEEELLSVIEKAKTAGLIVFPIMDAGHTEFHGVPTLTCCAIGPDKTEAVDTVTGELRLL